MFVDGVLVVDKPEGPTSHDIVAVARRITRTKVGHTGTLDPLASGVLPLVLGRATRLAQFLSSAEKEYQAEIELGLSTTTFDRSGAPVERAAARPVSALTEPDISEALASLRGRYMQQPPRFSAKKIDGDRAYDLARKNAPVELEPVEVTAHALELLEWSGSRLRVRLVCSAGFYVRTLADSLGERLGTGAHLARLIRTRSGEFALKAAASLAELDREPEVSAARVIRLEQLLPALPAITMTVEGAALAAKGGFLSPRHLAGSQPVPAAGKFRLLHPDGHLVAIAEPRLGAPRLLHPGIVLE